MVNLSRPLLTSQGSTTGFQELIARDFATSHSYFASAIIVTVNNSAPDCQVTLRKSMLKNVDEPDPLNADDMTEGVNLAKPALFEAT